ncbi:28S ribosomal protein S24, mitochondrial [Lamellibrachia satsuma]|nr:28S ribosomal protein S24, mitochondrial [Lamellibrachia satsuma]
MTLAVSFQKSGQLLVQLHGLGCSRLVARSICMTQVCEKNLRAGQYKITNNRSKPLTYEQAQPPYKIGVTKSWNSWNTSSLQDEKERTSETTVEDAFIRKFILGTWHNLMLSEVIIKRRHNLIVICGLAYRGIAPRKMYFLQGYTEELLACLLKRPVKVEIQTVESRKDMIFKWI